MKLYHLTSEKSAISILSEGFKLKESKYIQANGNGIYLTDKMHVLFWFHILQSDIYKNKKICIIECEIEDSLKMLRLENNVATDKFSGDYKKVHDWYVENKVEIDQLITENKRLHTLRQMYNKQNQYFDEQNKSGYIIELYCKKHSIDGVVCNKYHLEDDAAVNEYNDITIYEPGKIKPLSVIAFAAVS
ncbi:hypothetical protein [Acetobacterium tundrae]|uniref:DarT domain-containing protein n=1 Tax=Acetobacterium tundrae TaxID=132932 RepID=A0ABR6WKD5_9FIRM|nr:hypothetical protein [Acetobacterium tundrae]MBC3796615.1 hypothetical protein [Acetobacterium tundrae]